MKRVWIAALLLSCWSCAVYGQPRGSKRPFKSTAPTAWEAFNEYLRSFVPTMAIAAFDEVYKPRESGYKEHVLNDLAATRLQQKVVDELKEKSFTVHVSLFYWDATYPEGYDIGTTRDLGVVEYKECLHPPQNVLDGADCVIPQPCGEGGSVSLEARSSKFAYWVVQPRRPLRQVLRTKRIVLFYTPHIVWSLLSFPDTSAFDGPTTSSFISAFEGAMSFCEPALVAFRDSSKVNLGSYAKCLWDYYQREVSFRDHTGLRGLVIVPQILAEVNTYSSPGRSMPDGLILEFEYSFNSPAFVRQQASSNVKLWIFTNIPVVVSPLDCIKLLWDGCE